MNEDEEMRRNAARYLWLREQHWSAGKIAVVMNPKEAVKLGYYCPSCMLLDFEVDALMAQEKTCGQR